MRSASDDENFAEMVRRRMVETRASGSWTFARLVAVIQSETGCSYSPQSVRNFVSGSEAPSFTLAVAIAMTGLVPGVPEAPTTGHWRRRLFWRKMHQRSRRGRG